MSGIVFRYASHINSFFFENPYQPTLTYVLAPVLKLYTHKAGIYSVACPSPNDHNYSVKKKQLTPYLLPCRGWAYPLSPKSLLIFCAACASFSLEGHLDFNASSVNITSVKPRYCSCLKASSNPIFLNYLVLH